jgi:ketosteroid isomerase-like protein
MAPDMEMSEKAALSRRFYEAWNANDWEAMEACFLPDAEVLAPEGWPEAETSTGWPALRRQFERLKETWRDEWIEWIDYAEIGDDTSIQHGRWRGHGDASGLELDLEYWFVANFKDGLIGRGAFFFDGAEAQRAARGGSPA